MSEAFSSGTRTAWPFSLPFSAGNIVVIARAEKAYQEDLAHAAVLDVGVRTIPLAIANVDPRTGKAGLRRTLPQNVWGAEVVMPMF